MEISTIKSLLENILPKDSYIEVRPYKGISFDYIKIFFASSEININNVQGQKPDAVSLRLCLHDMDLGLQVFSGNGGCFVYRDPILTDPKEQYLAMKGIKVSFRTPQRNEIAVTKAIQKFAFNWVETLKANKEVLRYRNIVDYDKFLK